jgi:hypothetical protein
MGLSLSRHTWGLSQFLWHDAAKTGLSPSKPCSPDFCGTPQKTFVNLRPWPSTQLSNPQPLAIRRVAEPIFAE